MSALLEIAIWVAGGFLAIAYGCMTATLVPGKNGRRFGMPPHKESADE